MRVFCRERWNRKVDIPWLSVTSAGARRLNVLFDADDGETRHKLVVTAIPNANIELTPIVLEAQTIRTAEAAGVPVAHVVLDSDDPSYLGGGFFITRRIDGETVPRRVLRLVARCGNGDAVAARLGGALAALHAVPNERIPPHLVRPIDDDPAATSLARLEEQIAGLLQPSPAVSLGMRWLEARRPSKPARCVLVHGDARNGNLIVSESGLEALLDWEGVERRRSDGGSRVAMRAHVALRRRRERTRRLRAAASRWWPRTRRPAERSTPSVFIGGKCSVRCAGRSASPVRRRRTSTARCRTS